MSSDPSLHHRDPLIQPLDEHNQTLLNHVHPADWQNPTPAGRYNLVVIGGGTAGLVTAVGAAALGAKVALVERRLLGGDCLNVGCVPSKALLRCARAAADVRDAGQFGVLLGEPARVDFSAVMERMRRLRAEISPHDSAERFRNLGVDVYLGDARFAGPDRVVVASQTLHFARACIATGSRAAVPKIDGLEGIAFHTNETIFSLTELPRRLAVVGGGPIGCELAQAFARFGSEVVLVQRGDRLLPHDDHDASMIVQQAMTRDGVRVVLDAQLDAVSQTTDGKQLRIALAEGSHEQLTVDELLIGVGRVPNVTGLGLEAAGVAYDSQQGVQVNDFLQATNRRIYAAGDVCTRYRFTHMADALARIVIRNALFFGRAKASKLVVPHCTYTDPELAQVGLTAADAARQQIAIDTLTVPFESVDRAIVDGERRGLLKIHLKRGSDQIVGATLVARHAGEMLSELTLAIEAGVGLKTLSRTIHPYPTQAEAIKKAADQYQRTRLSPRVKRLLTVWLSWRR